ncbi:MAG: DNA repair protein RadA, partial [Actinobacteria bacterium]
MAARTVHACTECGHESTGWLGRCPGCGEWNTLVEERAPEARPGPRRSTRAARPVPLADVAAAPIERFVTGIAELDRVL